MIHSHFLFMILYAAFVAVVGGVLAKDRRANQVRAAGAVFGGLVGGALVLGWLVSLFPL